MTPADVERHVDRGTLAAALIAGDCGWSIVAHLLDALHVQRMIALARMRAEKG